MEVSGIMTLSRCSFWLPLGSCFRGNDGAVEGSFGKELLAWLI